MASSFIPALIIKHNNDVFLTPDLVVGYYGTIPTIGAGATIDGDYWAVPITDEIVSGFNFIPTSANSEEPPTPQSFHVFRITYQLGNGSWYVRGRTTIDDDVSSPSEFGYIQASNDAECCAEAPRNLPTDVPVLAPCQEMCQTNTDGLFFGIWSLPTLTGNLRYYPAGYFNGVAFPALTATGYATPGALVTALNGNGVYGAVGTWAVTADGVLTVTQADGPGTDIICLLVTTVNPSD